MATSKNIDTEKVIQDEIVIRTYVDAAIEVTKLLPHPSLVLKNISKQIDVFEKTLKQPDVGGIARRYRDGIKALEWDVSRVTQRGERATFFKDVCRNMNLDAIIPAAVSARDYGYTVLEAMWKEVDGRAVIVDLVEKPREWFRFDNANRLRLITKENSEGELVQELYPRKFIAVRHEASYKNPYGNGLLDEAYWYAKGLSANFEYHLGFLEDDGRDHWIGWVQPGSTPEHIDEVEGALLKLRNAAVAVLKEGVRVEKQENKGRKSSSDAFEQFKQSCKSTINYLWLGSNLATGGANTDSYASSKTGVEIEESALNAGKELAEYAVNTALQWIAEVNTVPGDEAEECRFFLFKAPANDKEQAETDEIYARAAGKQVSLQLLAKRGYEDGDFEDKAEPGDGEPTETFQAGPTPGASSSSGYNIEPLLDATEGLKKKYRKPPKPIS